MHERERQRQRHRNPIDAEAARRLREEAASFAAGRAEAGAGRMQRIGGKPAVAVMAGFFNSKRHVPASELAAIAQALGIPEAQLAVAIASTARGWVEVASAALLEIRNRLDALGREVDGLRSAVDLLLAGDAVIEVFPVGQDLLDLPPDEVGRVINDAREKAMRSGTLRRGRADSL